MSPSLNDKHKDDNTRAALTEVKDANDVGSLMKMRRYMTEGDFEAFRADTVKAAEGDPVLAKRIQKQFETANNNYLIAVQDMIESMEKIISDQEKELQKTGGELEGEYKDASEHIKAWRANMAQANQGGGLMTMDELQKKTEELARELSHLPDLTLKTTNEVYADQTGKVREKETAYNKFQEDLPKIEELLADGAKATDTDEEARQKRLADVAKKLE